MQKPVKRKELFCVSEASRVEATSPGITKGRSASDEESERKGPR